MNLTFFHSTNSRSASAARRSDCEQSSASAVSTQSRRAIHPRSSRCTSKSGIAADGRSEVRVRIRRQREVAHVFGAVARLLERPQHQVAEDALLRLAFDLGHQLLIHARSDLHLASGSTISALLFEPSRCRSVMANFFTGIGAHAQRIAEMRGHFFEFHHALGVRLFVDAVNGWVRRSLPDAQPRLR